MSIEFLIWFTLNALCNCVDYILACPKDWFALPPTLHKLMVYYGTPMTNYLVSIDLLLLDCWLMIAYKPFSRQWLIFHDAYSNGSTGEHLLVTWLPSKLFGYYL